MLYILPEKAFSVVSLLGRWAAIPSQGGGELAGEGADAEGLDQELVEVGILELVEIDEAGAELVEVGDGDVEPLGIDWLGHKIAISVPDPRRVSSSQSLFRPRVCFVKDLLQATPPATIFHHGPLTRSA